MLNCKLRKLDQKYVKIMSYNARSLNNKVIQIIEYAKLNEIDIIIIQEVWANSTIDVTTATIEDLGYNAILKKRNKNREGGGLGILYSSNVKVKIKRTVEYETFEHQAATITINNIDLSILNLYRPPYSKKNKYTINDFIKEYQDLIRKQKITKNHLHIGDFNIHMEKKEDKAVNEFLDLLENNNAKQLVNKSTHEKGGTIDLVIAQKENANVWIKVEEPFTRSDHFPIKITVNIFKKSEGKELRKIEYRDTKNMSIDNIKREISKSKIGNFKDKEYLKDEINAEKAVEIYNSCIKDIYDNECPVKSKTIDLNKKHNKWFTEELKKAKAELHNTKKNVKNNENNENAKKEYKIKRNRYFKIVEKARQEHYDNIIDNAKDAKAMYNAVKRMTGKNKKVHLPSKYEPKELPDIFRSFYVKKVEKINDDIERKLDSIKVDPNKFKPKPPKCELKNFTEIDDEAIRKTIKDLKDKTCITDPMPTTLVKECADELTSIIKYVANKTITSGKYPNNLKEASLTPVIKKPSLDSEELNSYRPVSQNMFLSKVLDKTIYQQLTNYIDDNELESARQAGYKAHNSTETLLNTLYDEMLKNYNDDKVMILICLDYSAAFDCIVQDQLTETLNEEFGIKDTALQLLDSYFKGRHYSLTINGIKSAKQMLEIGTGQGSILSSTGFGLATNQLNYIPEKHKMICGRYADDVSVLATFETTDDINSVKERILNCLNDILHFSMSHGLAMNSSKTCATLIAKKNIRKKYSIDIQFDGSPINFTEKVDLLGVPIVNDLSMSHFINEKQIKCRAKLAMLYRLKVRSMQSRKQLATSLVLSTLDYGNSLLVNTTKHNIKIYQKVIRSVVRYICKLKKYDSTSDFAQDLHILDAKSRIDYKIALLTWKVVHLKQPKMLAEVVKTTNGNDRLRNGKDLNKVKINNNKLTNITKRRFTEAANIFNKLDKDIRDLDDIKLFKKALKTHYFKKAYCTQ